MGHLKFASQWWMLPLLLVVWGLALSQMDTSAIWFDEAWTVHYIGAGPRSGESTLGATLNRVSDEATHENNPPGFYLMLTGWGHLVGWGDVNLRLFALLVGIPALAAIYRLGRDLHTHHTGMLSALLLGFCGFFVFYLHEMRTYSLNMTLAALGLLAYVNYMAGRGRSWAWGGVVVGCASGLIFTHYSNALVMLPLGLYHLFIVRKSRRWWEMVGLVMLAAATFLPYLPRFLATYERFVGTTVEYIPDWSIPDVLAMISRALTNEFWPLLIPLIVGVAWAIWRPQDPRQRQAAVFGLFLGLLGTGVLVVVLSDIFAHIRYISTLWVPLALMGGVGLSRLPWRWVALPVVVLWVGLGTVSAFNPQRQTQYTDDLGNSLFRMSLRWDVAGDLLQQEATPYDAVAVSLSDYNPWSISRAVEYYLLDLPARYLLIEFAEEPGEDLPAFLVGAARVWLLRATDHPPSESYIVASGFVENNYTLCGEVPAGEGLHMATYAISEACCSLPAEADATFDTLTALQHSEVRQTGDVLTAWMGWHTPGAASVGSYSVGLYLLDEAGDVVAQSDSALPATQSVCVPHGLALADVPPGDYTLYSSVYNWETVQPLPVQSEADVRAGTLYPLGAVAVE